MPAATEFRDYFDAELAQLREEAVAFAHDHQSAAHALALGQGRSSDPHVELLLQSFAFLTGRLRHQLDRDAALLPNALLAQLYPHLEAPVPSLTVAELTVRADGGGKPLLERGREFHAVARDEQQREVRCRMSTSCATPLAALQIVELCQVATTAYDSLSRDAQVHSVLKLSLRSQGPEPVGALSLQSLRCYLDIENLQVWQLYDLLALQLVDIAVDAGDGQLRRGGSLRWCGFDEDEAALACDELTHPGYRLVQEYFAFPEKFLFFDLQGLDFSGAGPTVDVLLLLSSSVDKRLQLTPQSLRLNCVPLINLFSQRIEPIALDHAHYEYRLSGDHAQHRYTEIYRIESLQANRPGQPQRPLTPYFELEGISKLEQQPYFYVTRRVESLLRSVPGTETYLSFLDPQLHTHQPSQEVIGGRARCTNRRLVEQLRLGDRLQLEGAGAVQQASVIAKPTPHQTPALLGGQPWALVSQLMLNHLSLSSGPQALGALKQMLRLHLGRASLVGAKQIDALQAMTVTPMVRPMQMEGRRVLVEGIAITLAIDAKRFDGGSPLLFGEVLRRFFALYASVNTVVELSLETDLKGRLKTWSPMVGAQTVL